MDIEQEKEELWEYVEAMNDEVSEYCKGLLEFHEVVQYSYNPKLITLVEKEISENLESLKEQLEWVEETYTHTTTRRVLQEIE